jgi:hypothetical protein
VPIMGANCLKSRQETPESTALSGLQNGNGKVGAP